MIDVTGNVGIGTTAPAGALDVSGVFCTATGAISIKPEDGTNEGGQINLNGAGSNTIKCIDNFGTQVRVHSGGATWANVSSTAGWQAGSSRELKQAITALSQKDYLKLRESFQNTPLYYYRRKDVPQYLEVGFIAEETPDLISPDHKGIAPVRGVGFLAAIAKDQENRIEALEKSLAEMFLRDREQQKEVNNLKAEIQRLKRNL